MRLQQLGEVVDQDFDLGHVEERRAVGLSLVFAHHPVEDERETLRGEIGFSVGGFARSDRSLVLTTHLPPEVLPVAVGLALPLGSEHLQLVFIEQLTGNSQDSSV